MQGERERSVAARASARLATLIARELELFATRSGRLLAFDVDQIQALAEHLAELASARPSIGLVDARDLADELGVARDWVYANAERLGGVRLGDGPRARLRFDAERGPERHWRRVGTLTGQAAMERRLAVEAVLEARPRRSCP
jgi:hypothetical protein